MQGLREAFAVAKRAQLASHGVRTPTLAIPPTKDWSSRVLELMQRTQWREAGAAAQKEFDRSGDPHAFLMMVRAAIRDERYFDALDLVTQLPPHVANSLVRGDLDALALEACIRTEKVNDAARLVERCIEIEGETPGLLLRKASLMGLQARFDDASAGATI